MPVPQLSGPPFKKAKLEMRAAPTLATCTPALLTTLQQVFGLRTTPADAADALHIAITGRLASWAHGNDRSFTYLFACYRRLPGGGGGGGGTAEEVFPREALLHHARLLLLNGEAKVSVACHSPRGISYLRYVRYSVVTFPSKCTVPLHRRAGR